MLSCVQAGKRTEQKGIPVMKFNRLSLFVLLSLLLFGLSFQSSAQNANEAVAPASLYVASTGTNKVAGLTPSQVRHAYGFDQIVNQGEGQTIGILASWDNPTIQADLNTFNAMFGLPASAFEKQYYPPGPHPPDPPSGYPDAFLEAFRLESSLDVEWAHAIAPEARIVLVETTDSVDDLMQAVNTAIAMGANVISMSFGVQESVFSPARQHFLDQNLSKPNVAFVASAGDTGNNSCHGVASLCWPGSSPNVTSVGGTKLHLNAQGDYVSEEAWKGPGTDSHPGMGVSGGGGGLSINEGVPDYQKPFNPYPRRAVPDVAYNANVNNGFPVYDSNPFQGSTGWHEIGGTSAGAPQWAALLAIANSLRKSAGKQTLTGSNPSLYSAATGASSSINYHDIVAGTNTNGQCGPLCSATVGYDFVTGFGSPNAANLISELSSLP